MGQNERQTGLDQRGKVTLSRPGRVTMIFGKKSLTLRRWTLTDERGQSTTVTISNVKVGARAPPGTFTIDYAANREFNTTLK